MLTFHKMFVLIIKFVSEMYSVTKAFKIEIFLEWFQTLRINCIYILTSDLCFILLQQPACTSPSRVISQVEHHHALSLPADEGAIYHPFYHGQEVLIAVMACGNHRESRPIKLLQNFKNNLQLQASGAQELQVDGATLLKEQKMWDMEKRCNIVFCINRETSERTRGITDFLSSLNFL